MNEWDESTLEDKLDAYLDGLMSPGERREFERLLRTHADLQAQIELQRRIDQSLRDVFAAPAVSREPMSLQAARGELPAAAPEEISRPSAVRRRMLVALLALAACIAWLAAAIQFFPSAKSNALFVERPLAEIYHKSIQQGFQPYWRCDDERQFAAVFAQRQGQALRLKPLPDGSRMLGLAYLGGMSEHTTAMLAHVDRLPVVVFVDRLERDQSLAAPEESTGLHLFRKEYAGLVLYELTPHPAPRVMDFLALADMPSGSF